MKPATPFTKQPVASTRQTGTSDPVLAMMQHHKMPMTRETYLNLAHMGRPPADLGPEAEAALPPQFQRR
jgi:hypothetical protein